MKKFIKIFAGLALASISTQSAYSAVAWSHTVAPTHIESIRSQGFMIFGPFGNNGTACDSGDALWVAKTHPQYDQLYSMAVSALMGGKKLRAYAHVCTAIGWHGGTFNEVTGSGAIFIYQ